MGIFDFFKPKPADNVDYTYSRGNSPESKPTTTTNDSASTENQLTYIFTVDKDNPELYTEDLAKLREFFGRLYKTAAKGTEDKYVYNIRNVVKPIGVYYGYTRYTEEVNRNGVKGVAFCLDDDTVFAELDRTLWKRYDTEAATDGLKWIGYSDGTDMKITVVKSKVQESYVLSILIKGNPKRLKQYLEKRVQKLNLPKGPFRASKAVYAGKYSNHNGKYYIAGINRYVDNSFVTFGYARREPSNPFNPKAIAIYTDKNQKIGYISEKELNKYYEETGGNDRALVIIGYYGDFRLCGDVYTFSWNEAEYTYMVKQYLNLLDKLNE